METRTIIHDGLLSDIKEHKHPETGCDYWHPVFRIHTEEPPLIPISELLTLRPGERIEPAKSDRTYVCISCEKPCVRTSPNTPYGCLSHHKHKNSQWKGTNITFIYSQTYYNKRLLIQR